MHISNMKLFAFALCVVLTGCTEITFITNEAPTGLPPVSTDDASAATADGGVAVADAGLPGSDAGTVGIDAGAPTALVVTFDGPPTAVTLRGTQDDQMFQFSLTAREDVEVRAIPIRIEGLTASDPVRGSFGTEFFRDLKIKDRDFGGTVMGPMSMLPGPSPTTDSGLVMFADSFVITASETRHFAVTMDVSANEDVPGEFFNGSRSYRVTVGSSEDTFFAADGVRRVADGSIVEPSSIENGARIVGNPITIVDASLAVSMAGSPFSTVAVSHELNIPSVGIVFTASAADVLVRSVRVRGTGDMGLGLRTDHLNDVVTACAFYNGDAQVGASSAPDPATGVMFLRDVNLTVPGGSSVELTLRCTADSVVALDEGDRYAVGIASGSDILAERVMDGVSVDASLASSLIANAGFAPANVVRVRRSGHAIIEAFESRPSTILVGDSVTWQNMGQFRVTAHDEAIELEAVRIASQGDAASFTRVAIAADGAPYGTDFLPAGADSERDVTLTSPLRVERDSSRTFQVWAQIASVVSSASVGGATSGVPLSGNRIRLGLAANAVMGEWDVNYTGSYNVRMTGVVSGNRLYTAGVRTLGNEFIIRKSKPTVTRETLATTTLTNGLSQDLYRFQVSADTAGSVAIHSIAFNAVSGGDVTLTGFGLRRGSLLMDTSEYDIVDEFGGNLEAGAISFFTGGPEHRIIIVFRNDGETVSGSGNVYTLQATPSDVDASDSISLTFHRTSTGSTGYLADDPVHSSLNVSPWCPASGCVVAAGFIWSDLSEVPHSDLPYDVSGGSGSRDWTDGYLVEDLTQTQTLTR